MKLLRFSLVPILGLLACVPVRAISVSEVQVVVTCTPAAARIEQAISLTNGPAGTRSLSVSLTNVSKKNVSLDRITVAFPWLSTVDLNLLVSSGGTTMGNWPGLVVDPARPESKPAQSGTYLLARHDGAYSLVGFLTWKTFWSKLRYDTGRVVMTADGEGRVLRPGETVRLEKLWFAEQADWQDLLFGYADEIARELRIRLKPRPAYVGWSTWDYYGRDWTPGNVVDHLAAVRELAPSANLLQIDGGWWPERGDYTLLRENLQPDGMKALADAIRAKGLSAGIHLDGMRGDLAARVVQEHPEYFLRDERGVLISVREDNDGDRLDHTYFDFSHPGAVAYMRDAIRHIRRDWGYDYIKIDFLLFGIAEHIRRRAFKGDREREIVAHDRALTSVERMHRGLEAFREGMGADAYFVACSAPFGPVFGHVDGLRTGPDIFPNFDLFHRRPIATQTLS